MHNNQNGSKKAENIALPAVGKILTQNVTFAFDCFDFSQHKNVLLG